MRRQRDTLWQRRATARRSGAPRTIRFLIDFPVSPEVRSPGPQEHMRGLVYALAEYADVKFCISSRHQTLGSYDDEMDGARPKVVRIATPAAGIGFFAAYELRICLCLVAFRMRHGRSGVVYYTRLSRLPLRVLVARCLRLDTVVEVNGPVLSEMTLRGAGRVRLAATRAAVWMQLRAATYLLAVSSGIADWAYVTSRRRPWVVPNGAAVPQHTWLPRSTRPRVIGFLGLTDFQELELVVDALAVLNGAKPTEPWSLLIVGGGSNQDDLSTRNETVAVSVTGFLSRAEAQRILSQRSDLAIAPLGRKGNHPASASPLKYFEYASVGIPIVSNGFDGLSDVSVDGVVTYSPGDCASLVQCLEKADANYQPLCAAAATRPEASWSWRDRAARILDILENS